MSDRMDNKKEKIYDDKLVQLNRVAKAVKGGRRFSFASVVVIGDKNGTVGYGQGKANDVAESIRKASGNAKKNLQRVLTKRGTIPHQVIGQFKSSKIIMKPAAPGTGVIAGGAARIVMDLCGVHDILCKNLGSRNPVNLVKAVFDGFSQLHSIHDLVSARDKDIKSTWGISDNEREIAD